MLTVNTRLCRKSVQMVVCLVLAVLGCAGVAHGETPYSYCLKTNGVPYDSNPDMYITLGRKVLARLQGGSDWSTEAKEMEKAGIPTSAAVPISVCAKKVNCPDLLHCGP
jgi:hypothetical protein